MKRKDMLKELSVLITHALNNEPFTKLPEIALSIVEEAGMLPPRCPCCDHLDNYPKGYEWQTESDSSESADE